MRSSRWLGLLALLGEMAAATFAHAQQPPVAPAPVAPAPAAPAPVAPPPAATTQYAGTPTAEAAGATATGFMVQARMQAQSSILSLGGGPGFLVGYHGPSFSL